jgi:hypothetical protein
MLNLIFVSHNGCMMTEQKTDPGKADLSDVEAFEQEANQPPITLWQEFCYLIVHEKKWWLVPILIALLLIALAVAFSSSAALPFIYTL